MNNIRTLVDWLKKHPILSVISLLLLIVLIIVLNIFKAASDGTLSESIKKGTLADVVYGIGTVTAARSYSVKPGVIATISELHVKEGDFVKKDTKLITIDHVTYRAPFNGVVNSLPFKAGENVFTQIPALTITDLSNRYLLVSLEQQGALRVRNGQKVKLSFDSIRQKNFEGEVESIYSYNNNFLARIKVTDLPIEILPDMTADVAIVIREVKDAIQIPINAFENGFVWVKRGIGLPKKTAVTLGVIDDSMGELLTGDVQVGDQLMMHRKMAP